MLRSMADPFELNVTSLSDPIREKAKEQSPQALLFCIRIHHFSLLCPEHSGGHFKSFLLGSVELCLDLCRGCRGEQADYHAHHQRSQEGGQQLVVCVVVSLVTPAPSAEIEAEFEAAK